jgi:hypothetical protein
MRISLLLALVFLIQACSLTSESEDTNPAEPTDPAFSNSPPPHNPEPVTPLDPPEPAPLPAQLPAASLDPSPTRNDDPIRSWDESEPPVHNAMEDEPKSLLDRLTAMYGVRLPRSDTLLSLETAVGSAGWTIPVPYTLPGGTTEFARGIVISVSKQEIFVNNYRVATIRCQLADGSPCPEGFDKEHADARLTIAEDQIDMDRDAFLVVPLLKQLEDIQRGRRAILTMLSEQAAAWLMDCDVFTIAADRRVPYQIIAQVVHTAGYADLTRFRLATLDDNDALTYVPVLAPRLDRYQKRTAHLVGDSWWEALSRTSNEAFPYAYLNYSASLYGETFAAVSNPELPGCLPLDVSWDKVMDDPTYIAVAGEQFRTYTARIQETRSELLGLVAPPSPLPSGADGHLLVTPPAPEPCEAESVEEMGTPGDADEEPGSDAKADIIPAGDETAFNDFPPNRLVDQKNIPGTMTVGSDKVSPDNSAPPNALDSGLLLRPFIYLGPDHFVLVFRTVSGHLVQALEVPFTDIDKLHERLLYSKHWAIGVGAHSLATVEQLVSLLDAVRFRCAVYAMSGKCKRWEPILPHAYLFAVPADRFMPAPITTPAKLPPQPDDGAEVDDDTGTTPPETAPSVDKPEKQPVPAPTSSPHAGSKKPASTDSDFAP